MSSTTHAQQVLAGERFEFGHNWRKFLSLLDEDRIRRAECSLQSMLEVADLNGKSFLDVGSGSGLFSLAARRLGAQVHSFDFDPESVACALELRRRFFPEDPSWTIQEGSALDQEYLCTLGRFDVVYSWGVLHHTGNMWQALGNVAGLVREGGKLFLAIYNDQGTVSRRWLWIKKTYNRLPGYLRFLVVVPVAVHLHWRPTAKDFLRLRPFASWQSAGRVRGMSAWRDLIDWVGGYPFEVAKPEAIFDFYRVRGFVLTRLYTDGGSLGCNEFVFLKVPLPVP
jgi:SAM-dependent methyltransferase